MDNRYIDESAIVKSLNIGKNTRIWQYVVILEKAIIGNNCNICAHCFIENDVIIGNNVTIKNGVQVWDGIEIEDSVFVGPNVTFTNDLYPRSRNINFVLVKTKIKKGASIGANATILAGIEIGRYAIIGAGSVVTQNVPDFGLVYGNPSQIKGYVCKCGKKICDDGMLYSLVEKEKISCKICGLKYRIINNGREFSLKEDVL